MKTLNARWSSDAKHVVISKGGTDLTKHPVEFVPRSNTWLKPDGNAKLRHHGSMGVVSSLSGGCFRALTGFERSNEACYTQYGNKWSGCYANHSVFATLNSKKGFDVTSNGWKRGTKGFFHVWLPRDDAYDLSRYASKLWRMDSETSTICLSLALGITQRWAEANPDKKFVGISSDFFQVSVDMLRWAARCRNVVVGHTLSSWFSVEELKHRIHQARRFQANGVATVLWLATRADWDSRNPRASKLIREEISNWDPRQIVEVPFHDLHGHSPHIAKVNPWGGCCETGVDRAGNYVSMRTGKRLDGGGKPVKYVRGTCKNCKLGCGSRWLGRAGATPPKL